MIIAIDGPSGAGKSTVAKEVAKRLDFACLDSGAMYRAVAWRALQGGVAVDCDEALEDIARSCPIEFGEPGSDGAQRVFIDGEDVTQAIRSAEIDHAVSPVSAVPAVRHALVAQQQRIGLTGDYVVEGRDIGTAVFPDAEVKVFLTASAAERARRRVAQNKQRGIGSTDFDEVLAELERRDRIDSTREESPLTEASDAYHLDSTDLAFDEVVETICQIVRNYQSS